MRIVICDDSVDNAESLAVLLESRGHQTFHCNDGETCLEKIVSWKPHVALLDVGMPEIDGYQVVRRIRQLRDGKLMFVAAVTGYCTEDDVKRAYAAGFDAHMRKPAPLDEIDAALGRARLMLGARAAE